MLKVIGLPPPPDDSEATRRPDRHVKLPVSSRFEPDADANETLPCLLSDTFAWGRLI